MRALLLAVPPVLGGAALLFRDEVVLLASRFPACVLRRVTGWWCPACGNTRSVLLLLHGDVAGALRHNPAPPILALLLLALYLEAVLAACGHPKRILPRSGWVWFPLLGAVLLFYGVRNFVPGLLPEAS